jgi:putative flippase GtrA
MPDKLLTSLTIFFPFFNDEGTVEIQITNAYLIGMKLTNDLEVIALHGGLSKDGTFQKILEMKKRFPDLVILDHTSNNEGYAVIKHGLKKATKEYVFYTDGDYQYHLEKDLIPLAEKMIKSNSDVANGYKKSRSDNFIRIFMGKSYAYFSRFIFELPIRDTDCDFRIIKKKFLDQVFFTSTNSSILPELIKKLQLLGCKFVEMPVNHYHRIYGISNYSFSSLFLEKLTGDIKLYFEMRRIRALEDKLRILRFAIVGGVSLILQISIFNLLILFLDLNRSLATFLSDQLPIIFSFWLNNSFTFQSSSLKISIETIKKFVKFYLIVITSTLIQTLVVFIGTNLFGDGILISNTMLILGIVLAFFWNYTVQSRIVWRKG